MRERLKLTFWTNEHTDARGIRRLRVGIQDATAHKVTDLLAACEGNKAGYCDETVAARMSRVYEMVYNQGYRYEYSTSGRTSIILEWTASGDDDYDSQPVVDFCREHEPVRMFLMGSRWRALLDQLARGVDKVSGSRWSPANVVRVLEARKAVYTTIADFTPMVLGHADVTTSLCVALTTDALPAACRQPVEV